MIEISVQQLSKYFGAKEIFSHISFELMTGERVGLIGNNGCGKTTLLKIIQGSEDCQSGSIQIRKGARVRYLDQFMDFGSAMTVQEVCSAAFQEIEALRVQLSILEQAMTQISGAELDRAVRRYGQILELYENNHGYDSESHLETVLQGLEIPSAMRGQVFAGLSGGEKTRVALARLLLENPDILLLDEPSNHLDIPAVEWLENFLKTYRGTVLIVSHDRRFLDQTVTRIIELQPDRAECYLGGYSAYVVEKERRFQLALHEYENQQKKIERMEEQIERYKIWGAMRESEVMEKNAKVLERKLNKIERLDRPAVNSPQMKMDMDISRRSGREVLRITGLAKSFGRRQLFADLDLQLNYRDRACLLGRNGCGKTTLLKIILQELPADRGSVHLGAGLVVGYLPQEVTFTDESQTLLDYFSRRYQITTGEAWSELARALFRKDDVHKQIRNLSGGERSRLKLCSLCYEKVNLLIMDEPTNHLDIESREVLENNLQVYEGTLLFVSHDRYFIEKVADQILAFEGGKIRTYPMGYADYCEQVKREPFKAAADHPVQRPEPPRAAAGSGNKGASSGSIVSPSEEIMKLETMIGQAEQEQKILESEIQIHGFDAGRLMELYQEKEVLEQKIDQLLLKWEQLLQV
ncbi:MAG: ABC-F type ribosomal protection protein [Clostridiaceae bacterium]|nr:ABC-F type ribosomal protection protein [Clostridiaceae bacterium]